VILAPTVSSLALPDGVVGYNIHIESISTLVADMSIQGRLPALGWNSCNAYHCDVTEQKILDAAIQIVDLGLKDVGYRYVNSMFCNFNHHLEISNR
jgi:hypothetical protein